ncbi:MAG: serine/threonine-protein kinase [Planctomycetota bacterium]
MKPIDSQSEDLEFTLFVGALKVPKSKRRAWVTEQCAGDHSLRVKVLSLLDQDESGNSLLEQGITADVIEEIQDATVRDLTARCSSCGRRDRLLTINGGLAECDECTDSHSVLDTSREQDDDMALPATIAHFQILETVGEGGFATVYRARDQKLGRVVALKVPHRGKLSRRQSERFLQEARTAAQLSHPRIVTVYEAGRSETGNETLYIASGYIEGGTLAQRLRQGEVSRQQLVETAFEIASALAHAHEIGVIHRDLKPSNILVDEEGHSHLADFGLAKRVSADQAMTLEGELIGTPVYMSPEQVRGDSDQIDASSDIYAFGVVLFEMLTNERPFRGSIQRILQQTLYDEPTDPRKLDPTIPADLATICLKCLEKSPNARYASSCELVEELDRYRRREPIKARPVGYVVRITRWARRKPVVAGLAVALVWASLITKFFAWRASVDARQLGIALGQEKHLVGEKNQLLVEKQSLIERLSAARDSEQIARETAETRTAEREAVFSFFREYILAPATVADQRMALRTDTTILEAMDAAEPRISEQFRDRPLIESAVRRTMASTYLRLGRYQSAIDQLRLTLDIETKYATLSRQAETMTELVRARVVAGQYQPALEICQRAHVLAQQAHGPKSEIALRASAEWGNAQRLAGQLGQAAKRLEQTLQAAEDALGEKHPITIATMRYLASCFGEMTRYDHAIQLHERAVRLGQSSVGEHDQTTLRSMQGLAVALANAGRESDAIRLLQIVAEGQAVAIGSSHPESLVTRGHVATMSRGTVDHEETVAELQYVLDHLREKIGPLHPDTLWVVRRLALVRYEMGEPQQAIELLRPLLPRVTSHFGSGHKLVASMMFDLSQYYWASGQHGSWVQAIGDHYQFQIARDEILPSRKHKVGWHLERYAGILNAQHCYEDAERISKQAVDRLRNDAGSDWLLDQAKFHLGSALL